MVVSEMSLNTEINREAKKLMDLGKQLAELHLSSKTLGHLADELRRRPSFNNAYKMPAAMTDHVKDLQVSVDKSENKLNAEWVQGEMRKTIEREKIVGKMRPTSMTFNGSKPVKIVLSENMADDTFTFVCGVIEESIDWKTGQKVMKLRGV